MLRNNDKSYGSLAKFFHWTIAITIIFMLFLGYFMVGQTLTKTHEIIGLVILVLATLRIIWTFMNQHPLLPAGMPFHEKALAKLVQILLYICMFGMPLSGWAMATSFGLTPHFGNFNLAMPGIGFDQEFGLIMEKTHLIFAWGIVVCLFLHVSGALKHFLINKDNVMQSMLPFSNQDKS